MEAKNRPPELLKDRSYSSRELTEFRRWHVKRELERRSRYFLDAEGTKILRWWISRSCSRKISSARGDRSLSCHLKNVSKTCLCREKSLFGSMPSPINAIHEGSAVREKKVVGFRNKKADYPARQGDQGDLKWTGGILVRNFPNSGSSGAFIL